MAPLAGVGLLLVCAVLSSTIWGTTARPHGTKPTPTPATTTTTTTTTINIIQPTSSTDESDILLPPVSRKPTKPKIYKKSWKREMKKVLKGAVVKAVTTIKNKIEEFRSEIEQFKAENENKIIAVSVLLAVLLAYKVFHWFKGCYEFFICDCCYTLLGCFCSLLGCCCCCFSCSGSESGSESGNECENEPGNRPRKKKKRPRRDYY